MFSPIKKERFLNQGKYAEGVKKGKISEPTQKSTSNSEDPLYFLKWAEYIFAQYITGYANTSIGGMTTSGRTYETCRRYALGQQDNQIYKDWVDKCDPNKTEGYLNINWDNVQIMPKFRDIVRGKLDSVDFEVRTKILDAMANKERLTYAGKLKAATNPKMQELFALSGGTPPDISPIKGASTPEDIDMLLKMGGISLQYEIFLTDLLEMSRDESSWDTTLKRRINEDIIDINFACVKTYLENSSRTVKFRYVDPANFICRATKDPAHEDIDYAGEVRRMTLSDLRIESGLDEETLMQIARFYKGFKGNGYSLGSGYGNNTSMMQGGANANNKSFVYDNFEVDVLDFCFIGKEVEKYIIGYRKDGTEIFDRVETESKLSTKDLKKGKEMQEQEVEYVYTGKWIVGTNFVFDYGKEYGIVRYNKGGLKRARLPYICYSDRSPSIVERCIPHIDDIQLAVLKKRNALAKMAPGPRLMLDKSLLRSSIDIGGKIYSLLDMVELYPKTGMLIYESVGEYDDPEMRASNKKPVDVMPTGISEDINICLQEVASGIDFIRQVTGVNEAADGSVQQADMLVGVMEGLNAAANNALKPIVAVHAGLFLNTMKYCAGKWQVATLDGDIEKEYIPINEEVFKTIQLGEDIFDRDLGISLTLLPSEADRQLLLQDLLAKRQNQQLSEADYMVAYNMIRDKEFKKAQLYIVTAVEQEKKRQEQAAMDNLQMQSQAQAQAAAQIEVEKQKTIQLQSDLKIKEIEKQGEQDRKTLAMKMEMERGALAQKGQQEMERDITNKVMDTSLMPEMQNSGV